MSLQCLVLQDERRALSQCSGHSHTKLFASCVAVTFLHDICYLPPLSSPFLLFHPEIYVIIVYNQFTDVNETPEGAQNLKNYSELIGRLTFRM